MSKIATILNAPGMTLTQYDAIINEMKTTGTIHQKAREYHVAAQDGDGIFVLDVWESPEAFNEFGKILIPMMEKQGVTPVQPKIVPVHNIMK